MGQTKSPKKEPAKITQDQSFLKGLWNDFTLDTKNGVPFYRQIIQLVENNVAIGRLNAGDKLPTIRALSITLKINPNTIAKAYMELEIRGIVTTQVGSGTYVSDRKVDVDGERERARKKVEEMLLDVMSKAHGLGVEKEEVINMLKDLGDR